MVWGLFEEFPQHTKNSPPPNQPDEDVPRGMAQVRIAKAPVDKPIKYGAKEFKAKIEDDAESFEFWLENTTRVLDKLLCTPEECLKCVVSLLKDTAYHWWKTVSSVVPKENITWEFFQAEFKKKYINQRFLDTKWKNS